VAVVTATPRNPLRGYKFRVTFDGAPGYVAGVRTVSGLNMHVMPFEVWEGGNNLHRYVNPNKINWDPIVLEQGLALDDSLEKWAKSVVDFTWMGKKPPQPLKRQFYIDVWDEFTHGDDPFNPAPQARARSYMVHNAWISKYRALPKLDSMASEVALLSVELLHEGWTDVMMIPNEE
jgi:phage tail-like protein